ncbi:UNVERIFIED_CONTAM: hypothetical protein Sindi_2105800 [Sesamum indicum]
MAYRRYLERAGFPQEEHWTLNVEQRLMWMIVDDNTRVPMRDDRRAEAHMNQWVRGLRRHFGYHYTQDQVRQKFYELKERFRQFHEITQIPGIYYDVETFCMDFPDELRPHTTRIYPLARRYYQYPEPHYPSMLEIWGPIRLPLGPAELHSDGGHSRDNPPRSFVRGGEEAPIIISGSTAPTHQTHTHIASWDVEEQVARGDGGPRLARNISLAPRRSLDMGSGVGGIGSWTDYIRRFGVQSDRGGHSHSEGDSTARSRRPTGIPPRRRDGP